MCPPVSITVAPNGARRGKAAHPALPLSPEALAREARACEAAGAAILHLHVRDDQGAHSLDPGRYQAAIEAVRAVSSLIVQPTTERVGVFAPADMLRVQRALLPESITFNLQELLTPASEAQCAQIRAFLAEVAAAGTVPQYIVYSVAQLECLKHWWEQGWVPQARPWVLLVLGGHAGAAGRPADLLPYLAIMPQAWCWSVCAFGASELACVVQAALAGGHCRVGFENNLERTAGVPLEDNAEQVGRLAAILRQMGYPVATPAEARDLLGIRTPPGPA